MGFKIQSEGERREKGKEVGSTSIPFSHSPPLIGVGKQGERGKTKVSAQRTKLGTQ